MKNGAPLEVNYHRHLSAGELVTACLNRTSVILEGVRFDFTRVGDSIAKIPGRIDSYPFAALVRDDEAFTACFFKVCPGTDSESPVSGDWQPLRFPWSIKPSLETVGRDIRRHLQLSDQPDADSTKLKQRFWEVFEGLFFVRPGDVISFVPESDPSKATEPFAHPSDRYAVRLRIEVWRDNKLQFVAGTPLEVRSQEHFAANPDFLSTLEERVFNRSSVRRPRSGYRPGGFQSALMDQTDWDIAARALVDGYDRIEDGIDGLNQIFVPSSPFRCPRSARRFLMGLFEAGARFGWVAKAAETEELMKPDALKHYQRRLTGKESGERGARGRTRAAKVANQDAQALADDMWLRHPNLSKSAVAKKIAKRVGKSANTIRQGIRKPDK